MGVLYNGSPNEGFTRSFNGQDFRILGTKPSNQIVPVAAEENDVEATDNRAERLKYLRLKQKSGFPLSQEERRELASLDPSSVLPSPTSNPSLPGNVMFRARSI